MPNGFGRGAGFRRGRGFGFRGSAPPWPYVGRGRGGLPRCAYFYGEAAGPPYGPSWGYGPWGYDPSIAYGPPPPGYGPEGYGPPPPGYEAQGYGPAQPWQGYGSDWPYGSPPGAPAYGAVPQEQMTREQELGMLKQQAETVKQQLEQLESRMRELESEEEE